jgi:hypothetical protein
MTREIPYGWGFVADIGFPGGGRAPVQRTTQAIRRTVSDAEAKAIAERAAGAAKPRVVRGVESKEEVKVNKPPKLIAKPEEKTPGRGVPEPTSKPRIHPIVPSKDLAVSIFRSLKEIYEAPSLLEIAEIQRLRAAGAKPVDMIKTNPIPTKTVPLRPPKAPSMNVYKVEPKKPFGPKPKPSALSMTPPPAQYGPKPEPTLKPIKPKPVPSTPAQKDLAEARREREYQAQLERERGFQSDYGSDTTQRTSNISKKDDPQGRVRPYFDDSSALNTAIAEAQLASQRRTTKAIPGGNQGKGTPLGDLKDQAMRKDSNAAIVELQDVSKQKEISKADRNAIGNSSSETSLLQLGSPTGDLSGKTIMLARNGKLANKPLREETVQQIIQANKAGAKFVVGDMPGVDSEFIKLLKKIKANYVVYHTGNAPRINT